MAESSNGLLAIRYERGRLELLDQRLLPFESTYIPVPSPQAAYEAIKSMVVRGAPAIGCTAALAVAAWLEGHGAGSQFASAAAAASDIQRELDHLVTSRPTAVNLQDACHALSKTAKGAAAAPTASAQSVAEAVIAAAEAYFQSDVATCKAIGGHGADALVAAAKAAGRGAADGGLRVLTHCNTGALATAAYGTALGVVRALAERGSLQHAYCTETRPYNQGSRLTAYELVQEGLPSTLIADSAAAALMASGAVDAVVVGADRIVANGDTANKIGTYSLAVNAAQHRIPFFIAAPLTTVDVATADGGAIEIEQREPTELTHFRGQRVAAEGIGIWNPSFDVTPAPLIEGIITEFGLIPKAGAAFAVVPFVASQVKAGDGRPNGDVAAAGAGSEANQGDAAAPGDAAAAPGHEGFVALDETTVVGFVAGKPHLAKRLGGADTQARWKVREVGDGNINYVYILEGPGGALCLKQGHPYVRIMKSWALTQDRVRVEAEVLSEEGRHAPEHVPAMLDFDPAMFTIAMAYVGPPAVMLRLGLNAGEIYPRLGSHMGAFAARTLFHTSLLALDSSSHRKLKARFANDEMCRITEALVFQEPYDAAAKKNKWTSPQLDADVAALHADVEARSAAARLQVIFMERAQALLHGDLHSGSLLVTPDTTHVIDAEFGFVGPIAFDVGKFIGNLFIAFFASDGHATDAEPRAEQRTWLLQAAAETWTAFSAEFVALWSAADPRGGVFAAGLFTGALLQDVQKRFMADLLAEALGFGGACIIRRLVGMAHTVDMDAIASPDVRAVCERRALRFGRALLVGAADFATIEDVAAFADMTRQDGAAPLFPLA